MSESRSVLVTGGGGRVGNAVVRELIRQGFRVRTMVRSGQRPMSLQGVDPLEIVKGDVLHPETLRPALEGITDVLHVASIVSLKASDRERMEEVNVQGTKRLLEAALDSGVQRFTHMSSCEAFTCAERRQLVDETAPLATASARGYARSKARATELSLGFNSPRMKVCVVAPTSVVGPLDFEPSMQAREFLRSMKGSVAMVPAANLDVVDVRDVATATIRSLDAGRGGESYLLGAHDVSSVELTRQLRQYALGRSGRMVALDPRQIQQGLKVQDGLLRVFGREPSGLVEGMEILRSEPRFDHAKASRELEFNPRPLEDTARDIAGWLKDRTWLNAVSLDQYAI